MPVALVLLVTAVVYLLHQDFWFWRSARPLVFGFLPIGLAYHAAYTIAVALFMWALATFRWPSHLEDDDTFSADKTGPTGGLGGAKPPGKK